MWSWKLHGTFSKRNWRKPSSNSPTGERLILEYFMDERSDAEIGEALHITKSGAREARYKLFAKLKALLSAFADYLKK